MKEALLGVLVTLCLALGGWVFNIDSDVELMKYQVSNNTEVVKEVIPRLDKSLALMEQSVQQMKEMNNGKN